MVREARDRDRKTGAKAVGGIDKYMENLVKELERARYEEGTDGSTLAFTKAKAHRLASDIYGVRKIFKWGEENHRASVDRVKATAGSERSDAKRLDNILE